MFKHKHFANKHKGFTLIELLVVIAIIGILSSVVLASLNSTRVKARDVRRVGDIKQIQVALELYYDANNKYPAALSSIVGSGGGASMSVLPKDPNSTTDTVINYRYAVNNATTPTQYHLGASLEQVTSQTTLGAADRDLISNASPTDWSANGGFNGADDKKCDGATDGLCYDASNQ